MAATRHEARGNAREPDGTMCRDARLPWMLASEIKLHILDKWACLKGVVSRDHVHILASCPPSMAPSEIMSQIKGRTSSKLFEEFPHLKKRYWGRHFWARGYFCATVGQMTKEMIKQYLEHHFEPKQNDDFKMEPD